MSLVDASPRSRRSRSSDIRRETVLFGVAFALLGGWALFGVLFASLIALSRGSRTNWTLTVGLAVAVIFIGTAAALWRRSRWARPMAMAVHAFVVFSFAVDLWGRLGRASDPASRVRVLVWFVPVVLVLALCGRFWWRREVKAWFDDGVDQQSGEPAVKTEPSSPT